MKVKNLIILIIFFISIFFSTLIINKYDKYEVSSDTRINHTLIKADILRFYKEADYIKKKFESGSSLSELGQFYYSSYLPPKIIALYYILISEDFFLYKNDTEGNNDWKKDASRRDFTINSIYADSEGNLFDPFNGKEVRVKKDNNKITFIYFQISIFFLSILYFYKILKKNIGKTSMIIFLFLIIEPTIHQFNYSFYSESIFFSLNIFLIAQIIKGSNNKSNAFFIGLLVGILYLQRSIAIFYFIPILIFFILERKKLNYIFTYLSGIFLIILFLGTHNYFRAGVIQITPYQSKADLYYFMIPNILKKKENKIAVSDLSIMKEKIDLFKIQNNSNLTKEKDLLIYGNYVRNLSVQYLLNNPLQTIQVMIQKTAHALNFNPFEIYSFYKYEYKPVDHKLRYYKSSEHQKFLVVRIIYSIIIYSICLLGFLMMLKKKELLNIQIFLTLSILYYIVLGGWHGNPRYLSSNIIFLSVFFGFGFLKLKEIVKL